MSETFDKIEAFKREKLIELLNQCTEKQQAFFDRMYGSRDTIPSGKINWAIEQCERTIANNKKIRNNQEAD